MKLHRIGAVALKEWRELVRDPIYLSLAFLVPVMMLIVLGSGLVLDVKKMPMVVWDMDKQAISRELVDKFRLNQYFDYRGEVRDRRQLDRLLKAGEVRFALVIPADFSQRLQQGRTAQLQTLIDGQFTYHARIVKGYVQAIVGAFNQQLVVGWMGAHRGIAPERLQGQLQPVRLEVRYLYNQALKSEWSIPPALIGMIMLTTPALLLALAVVREKERGSIFNIYASTLSKGEFLLGKLLPYVGISLLNLLILVAVVLFYYGAPFKGSWPVFLLGSFIFLFSAAGIGLLVSILVRTEAAAALITLLGTMIPGFMFSGMIMPIESMSAEAQFEAHLFPVMYYMQVIWGSFLKGLGWQALAGYIGMLVFYGIALMVLAHRLFKKRVRQ